MMRGFIDFLLSWNGIAMFAVLTVAFRYALLDNPLRHKDGR